MNGRYWQRYFNSAIMDGYGFREERHGSWREVPTLCWRCHAKQPVGDNWVTVSVESPILTGEIRCCGGIGCLDALGQDLHNGDLRVTSCFMRHDKAQEYLELRDITDYQSSPPGQSNASMAASPSHNLSVQYPEPSQTAMRRDDMVTTLIARDGMVCQGCNREFEDPLYLEVDHVRPKSEGGEDHIRNRVLLCGPCNRIKSNKMTLSGLRERNKDTGRMMAHPVTAQPMQNSFTVALQMGGVR